MTILLSSDIGIQQTRPALKVIRAIVAHVDWYDLRLTAVRATHERKATGLLRLGRRIDRMNFARWAICFTNPFSTLSDD